MGSALAHGCSKRSSPPVAVLWNISSAASSGRWQASAHPQVRCCITMRRLGLIVVLVHGAWWLSIGLGQAFLLDAGTDLLYLLPAPAGAYDVLRAPGDRRRPGSLPVARQSWSQRSGRQPLAQRARRLPTPASLVARHLSQPVGLGGASPQQGYGAFGPFLRQSPADQQAMAGYHAWLIQFEPGPGCRQTA